MKEFPPELKEYLERLPSSTQNNSRAIVRADFERILKLNKNTAAKILEEKYDIYLDPDHTPGYDDGEPPFEVEST